MTTYETNLKRLTEIAESNGLVLNPDQARIAKVVGLMSQNFDVAAEWVCPCKQKVKPAQKGMDKLCPCPEWLDEVKELGHCFCRLFYTKEKAEETI